MADLQQAPFRKSALFWYAALAFAGIASLSTPLRAQKVVSARAGLITYVQGPAFVDAKRIFLRTTRFPQMNDGETLSTGRGRAEVLLAPGVILRLAENAQLRMDHTALADTRVTLLGGDSLIEILQLAEGSSIQLNSGETVIELSRPGLYRIGKAQNGTLQSGPTSRTQNTLRVYGGEALVRSGRQSAVVKRGMMVNLNAGLSLEKFDRKLTDSMHAWAARRSFDLYMSDPDARQKQTHWQYSGGYMENKSFGVVYRAQLRRGLPPPLTSPTVPRAENR